MSGEDRGEIKSNEPRRQLRSRKAQFPVWGKESKTSRT